MGYCEPYKGSIKFCNTSAVDYVFITSTLQSQDEISELIQNSSAHFKTIADLYCQKQIQQMICNYYLMPCDTENLELYSASMSPEDCFSVQSACSLAWTFMQLEFSKLTSFINCSDIGVLLHPMSNCCIGEHFSSPSTHNKAGAFDTIQNNTIK